ncbi:hypothetical protein IW262DRAFT_1342250 [Armillaria fumosa]|nr:hypothetical protein IW262DRAFT_1342250 [Armillaria fumosa]
MNKNPFIPQPSYTPQQPPLPPGPPPPPQPAQADYSAYWAAAASAQAQQQHGQAAAAQYNPQWPAAQPPRPPAEQSALYANYGYGPQQNHWQRQQQQQQQQQQQFHHPPPPPVAQPPPPPPGYNPYQPAVGYTPYLPQVTPMAQAYPMQQPQQQQPGQQMFPLQIPQQQNRNVHHPSPQHLPPAKRQRFDGPSQIHQQHRPQPPPPPQFQPPPAPSQGMSMGYNQPGVGGRGGGPMSGNSMTMGRGGGNSNRGGGTGGGRGGRGQPGGNRGGMGGRGRNGSGYVGGGGSGGRGSLRGHGSRGNFGGGNNRRGGGSFNLNSGSYSHQPSNFRGRGQGHSNRGGRHDGTFGNREGSMTSSFGSIGKKDENKRTLTDFRIIGLEIRELSWAWGTLPSSLAAKVEPAKPEIEEDVLDEHPVDVEANTPLTDGTPVKPPEGEPISGGDYEKSSNGDDATSVTEQNVPVVKVEDESVVHTHAPEPTDAPPSRIRIYFHTPVTAEDAQPIPHSSTTNPVPSDSRKGKRKKLEDDDMDLEEGRTQPPPPHMSDDRSSVAPSVAETASETDWLMAAIVEGEDAEHDGDEEEVGAQLHVSENAEFLDDDVVIHNGMSDAPGIFDVDMAGVDKTHTEAGTGSHNDDPNDEAEHVALAHVDGPESAVSAPVEQEDGQNGVNGSSMSTKDVDAEVLPSDNEGKPHDASDVAALPEAPVLSSLLSSDDAASSVNVETQTADHVGCAETQVSEPSPATAVKEEPQTSPLSRSTTLVDIDSQPPGLNSSVASLVEGNGEPTQSTDAHLDHLPEPPASPLSNMQSASTSTASAHGDTIPNMEAKSIRTPSANRLSISYSNGGRRLIIDAEVVESMKVYRAEGRIEVRISISMDGEKDLKGIILEGLSDTTHSYVPLLFSVEAVESDSTLPPFTKSELPTSVTLIAYLDTTRPLSEPKWVKTGDIQDWLRSMFGRMFWVAGDAAEGWEKKIAIVDPDPPPTIRNVLDGWAVNSPVGAQNERERFVKTHMTEMDNLLEILLRLVRGERATPFLSGPTISTPSIVGPLLSALSPDSAHGGQQTHVSLAVLAIFRLATEYAQKVVGEKGKNDVDGRVGEIIRCLPSHLIYKSLDGIFKEWRVEKKGH